MEGSHSEPPRHLTMSAIQKARSLHKRNNRGFVKSPRIARLRRDGAS